MSAIKNGSRVLAIMIFVMAVCLFANFGTVNAAELGEEDLGGGPADFGFDSSGNFSEGNVFGYGYQEGGIYPYAEEEAPYQEGGVFPYEYGYEEGGVTPYGYDTVEDTVYYDEQCSCYSYGSSGQTGGGYSIGGKSYMPAYSSNGYSMVKPITIPAPSYQTQTKTGSSITNTTVTNTNITNVDNSINGSFNNYNSNNVTTAYLAPATPQYPVVYTAPAPYCVINQALAAGSGVTAAYLSWTSTNATSAYLSNVGSVAINGSQTVWPTANATYILTVYGQNGQSAQCQVTVYAQQSYPAAPYVSLTQIPYTGFDFGPVGNAIYWTVLAGFAIAASYLAIYFRGGAFALAGAMLPKRAPRVYAPVVAPKAPILLEKEASTNTLADGVQPIVASIRKSHIADTMAIVASKDGSMPKIVITRS